MGFRIVEAQGEAFDVAAGAVGLELLDLGTSVPDFAGDAGAVKFDPGVGAGEAIGEAL